MAFLELTITRQTLKLAIPVMITQLGQVSVNLFDNIIVGRLLGADALASASLANSIFFSFFMIALGMSFAIPPLVSEAKAKKNHQRINRVFSHGFLINTPLGFILMGLILVLSPLLYHSGEPLRIIPKTISFLQIMSLSMVPFLIFQTMREISEGLGYTIGVTKATIFANIINIALNYIFIKGLFGITPMGVNGSAYATLIARIFMVIFLYFVLVKEPTTRRYVKDFSLKRSEFSKKLALKIIRIGIPTSMQLFFELNAFAVAAFICGAVSVTDIAAHQIALTMASFTFNLCVGFSVASTVLVGNSVGERNFVGLKSIGINNLKMVFLFMLMCSIIFILGRNILPTFFTKKEDYDVIKLASKLLIVASLFQLSDGTQIVAIGSLRGLKDVKVPSFITFIAYWVITIPLGYFLCVTLNFGAIGMWAALGVGLSISAFLLVRRFLDITNQYIASKKVVQG